MPNQYDNNVLLFQHMNGFTGVQAKVVALRLAMSAVHSLPILVTDTPLQVSLVSAPHFIATGMFNCLDWSHD